DDLQGFTFPSRFVLKANHGSGWNYIHHGGLCSRERLIQLARRWMRLNYALIQGEWCYSGIQPRIFCEEYLGRAYSPPVDYKVFCFSGTARFIQAIFDRHTCCNGISYDRELNVLDLRYPDYPRKFAAPVPANPAQMLSIAERLSDGVDFVRVDLYDLGDRVVFGELTNYPGGLLDRFYPQEWDATFGSYWRLPVQKTLI